MAATSRSSSAAALARNSSQTSSSSQSQVYRHPIVYDKLTGATNNQINDVLGAKQPQSDYPLDHYQQQSGQQTQQQFNSQLPGVGSPPVAQDADFFANMHRQPVPPPPGFPAHSMQVPPPHHRHLRPSGIGHHPMQMPNDMMTTQPPNIAQQQNRLGLRLNPSGQQANLDPGQLQTDSQPVDSLPSASSLNNNGARPAASLQNATNQLQAHQQQQQEQLGQFNQQPIYYTPPIFAYNNFDQNRPLSEPQVGAPFAFPQQHQQQQPPLGVPEPPMSIDEYNARQARLRQINQQLNNQQASNLNEVPQVDRYAAGKPANLPGLVENGQNLLADPQQQQRHKQQMLDRQLLFGSPPPPPAESSSSNKSSYYPDPALYRSQMSSGPMATSIRPPYAHSNVQPEPMGNELASLKQVSGAPSNRILPASNHRMEPPGKLAHDNRPVKGSPNAPANHLMASAQQPQFSNGNAPLASVPQCASRQQQVLGGSLEMANSSSQLPVLFCSEDSEYPTKEIMRALENYASERPVEQLLPQSLVQLHLAQRGSSSNGPGDTISRNNLVLGDIQRQLTLDSLQPSISVLRLRPNDESLNQLNTFDADQQQQVVPPAAQLFPSANYEPMCRSSIYMAQPRRAKNLIGQWKVVVNLPGHKYRGTAVSQMIRVEECSRPNSECAAPPGQVSSLRSPPNQLAPALLPKSRCLQHYENQRLVAWSNQLGLHVDIFRVPIACSCHIRR